MTVPSYQECNDLIFAQDSPFPLLKPSWLKLGKRLGIGLGRRELYISRWSCRAICHQDVLFKVKN